MNISSSRCATSTLVSPFSLNRSTIITSSLFHFALYNLGLLWRIFLFHRIMEFWSRRHPRQVYTHEICVNHMWCSINGCKRLSSANHGVRVFVLVSKKLETSCFRTSNSMTTTVEYTATYHITLAILCKN